MLLNFLLCLDSHVIDSLFPNKKLGTIKINWKQQAKALVQNEQNAVKNLKNWVFRLSQFYTSLLCFR